MGLPITWFALFYPDAFSTRLTTPLPKEPEEPHSTVDVLELEPNPEELEAYAEEYAAIRDFEDLTEEDLFLSDIEGETDFLAKSKGAAKALREAEHDVDMTC
jgi:hypothetical protein